MRTRLHILTLILPLLAASPVPAAQKVKDVPKPAATAAQEEGSLDAVLDDVARGWMSRNADLILRHFGTGKVVIDVEGGGGGGTYSRDQGHYVFKTLFRSTVTRKFDFVQIRQSNDEGTASFAIAERRYQPRDDGRVFRDKVYIALHVESGENGERWVLDEIKSIR